MTKEEILDGKNGFFYTEDFVYHKESVKEAMDEYAKQESILFSQWVYNQEPIKHGFYAYYGDNKWRIIKPQTTREPDEYKTTEELYELYLKQKEEK